MFCDLHHTEINSSSTKVPTFPVSITVPSLGVYLPYSKLSLVIICRKISMTDLTLAEFVNQTNVILSILFTQEKQNVPSDTGVSTLTNIS